MTITLRQPGATALINVTTDTGLVVSLQYMSLAGVDAAHVAWNLPLATDVTITGSVSWQGLVLAPNAAVRMAPNGQFNGQVIAADIPAASRTLTKVAFAGCLPTPQPPSPPDASLTLTSLCISPAGDATMRLRNTSDHPRQGTWIDVGGTDFGTFDVPAGSDLFFTVDNPTSRSVVTVTSTGTTTSADVSRTPCQGQITVRLVTTGSAPAGATWDVRLDAGIGAAPVVSLGSGDEQTLTLPGGYVPGTAPIDRVIGGVAYTVSVRDTLGGTATVSLNPIEILDGQHEIVTVMMAFEQGAPTPTVVPPIQPDQPTLPPGAPDPLPGPDLNSSASGTDLLITHAITPRRLPVNGILTTVTRVRNRGPTSAVGVVAREIPQYHSAQANSVAHVLSISTSRGHCTSRRPVHCSLGTLRAGASVAIRTRTRVLVPQPLRSIVVVSSTTPDTDTTNNMATALVTTFAPPPAIRVTIGPSATVHVGERVRYRVTVTGGGAAGADSVRLCTRPPATLIAVRAPATSRFQGDLCQTADHLGARRTLSFTVSGLASAPGRLLASDAATATDVARRARASTRILVLGPRVDCSAMVGQARRQRPPIARAAC